MDPSVFVIPATETKRKGNLPKPSETIRIAEDSDKSKLKNVYRIFIKVSFALVT